MRLEDLRRLRDQAREELSMRSEHRRFRVVVCMGTSGLAKGSREVMDALVAEVDRRRLTDVEVVATGSSGVEDLEPIVTVEERDAKPVVYGEVTPEIAKKIINEHIIGGTVYGPAVIARERPREVE